jgi:phospholipid-translocating ATPase
MADAQSYPNRILNFFFKNIVGVAVLFFFQIYCAWSTT